MKAEQLSQALREGMTAEDHDAEAERYGRLGREALGNLVAMPAAYYRGKAVEHRAAAAARAR